MYILLECDLPKVVVGILRQVYNVLMIAIPAGIVLFGTIDFLKASMAKDDKAATTNATIFIKRLVSGALALFVFALVKMVFTIIGNVNEASQAFACASDILGGKYKGNGYYNIGNILNSSVSEGDAAACFGKQYGACISTSQSSNKVEECTKSADIICGTNHEVNADINHVGSNNGDGTDINHGGSNFGGGGGNGKR